MKLRGILCACALFALADVHRSAHAADGLSKVVGKEVQMRQLNRCVSELKRAASRFDSTPTRAALTAFKIQLRRTATFLERTEGTVMALSEALKDSTGQHTGDAVGSEHSEEMVAKSAAILTRPRVGVTKTPTPQPQGDPNYKPAPTNPLNTIF